MASSPYRAPTVDTEVNFWPGVIDMLTSLLMFFMLVSFVQHNVNPSTLASDVARQKQRRFHEVFEREYAAEMARGEISVVSDVNIVQVTFGEEILFASGQYGLQNRGEKMLRRLARVIDTLDTSTQSPLYDQIQIEGHTDSRNLSRSSYPRDNWELSTARALEVLRFLSDRSVPRLDEKTMSANGYADTRPVTSRSRSKNRRIEIRIYFSGRDVRAADGHTS
jgi:flagellar motor protein MotB